MKILTMIIIGTILVSFCFVVYQLKKNDSIKLGDIEIGSKDLDTLTKPLPEGQYALCSLKPQDRSNPCVIMFKRSLE